MIDVNWNLAPEGAEKIIQYNDTLTWAKDGYYWYIDSDKWVKDDCENENIVIATRPTQTKTVADAVEYHNGAWPNKHYERLYYNPKSGEYFCSDNPFPWYQFTCTSAEFESYVKEQEVEKWTHTRLGDRCRIACSEADSSGYIVVLSESYGYELLKHEALEPIKPAISKDAKRQLELYVQYRVDKYGDHDMKPDLSDYLSHHDII